MKSKIVKSNSCLNCQQELDGENFCPNCGQKNDARRLTAWHFITESLSNSIAFDGRFFNTLINLIRHPGKVPKDFIEGKRTRYMNPIRIYFLSSILLLFLIQVKDGTPGFLELKSSNPEVITDEQAKIPDSLQTLVEADTMENSPQLVLKLPEKPGLNEDKNALGSFDLMRDFYREHKSLEINEALDSLGMEAGLWNRFMYAQAAKAADFDTEEFNRYFLSKLFWVLFLFIPILGLLLKLTYIRRPFFYPEHLIFAFFNQAVFFLLFSISIFTFPILLGLFAFYLLIAMRKFYKQSWGKTIMKFLILNMLLFPAFITFTLISMLIVFLTL